MKPIAQQSWPSPNVLVTVTKVANILGVDRTTLSKPIKNLKAGALAGTNIPEINVAAQIFVDYGSGTGPSVLAALLIKALGINANQVGPNPPPSNPAPKEIRYRISKKQIQDLRRSPDNQVLGAYAIAHSDVVSKGTLNRRRWMGEIITVMKARKIVVLSDGLKRIEGLNWDKFSVFATLSGWTAQAGSDDFRLFARIEGKGRPLDFLSLPQRSLRKATFVFLDLDGWLKAMKKGLAEEKAAVDGKATARKTPKEFASLSEWAALAAADDTRLFMLIEGKGRPVDPALVPKRVKRNARSVFLDVSGWLKAIKKGLGQEHAEAEAKEIGIVTRKPKKPGKGPPRP